VVFGGPVKIGVLGGIGPEATAEFYRKLVNKLQERGLIRSNTDFPQIVINSIPAPELTGESVSKEEIEPYAAGLRELDSLNADFIVMVCNTIHLFYNELQRYVKAQIIDLRKEVMIAAGENAVVMGTLSTVKSGMYGRGIGLEEAKLLSRAVFEFNRGEDKEKQKRIATKIYRKYAKSATVIFGCTEIALMLNGEKGVNTIDVLVDATIRNYIKVKKLKLGCKNAA